MKFVYKLFTLLYLILLLVLVVSFHNSKQETFANNDNQSEHEPIKIHVINLKKDVDRLSKFKNNCKNQNIEVIRHPAIYGKHLKKDDKLLKKYISKDFVAVSHYNYDATIGCALSHVTLYNKLYNEAKVSNDKFFIICEDDAIVLPNFEKKLNVIFNELPQDWDFVYLGSSAAAGKRYSKNLIKPNFAKTNWGFFAYMVSKSGLEKLVKHGNPINRPVDNYYKDDKFKINYFTCAPFLIKHDFDNISNITGVNRKKDTIEYNKIHLE